MAAPYPRLLWRASHRSVTPGRVPAQWHCGVITARRAPPGRPTPQEADAVRAPRTLLAVAALSLVLTACGSNDPDVVVPPGSGLPQSEQPEESEEEEEEE